MAGSPVLGTMPLPSSSPRMQKLSRSSESSDILSSSSLARPTYMDCVMGSVREQIGWWEGGDGGKAAAADSGWFSSGKKNTWAPGPVCSKENKERFRTWCGSVLRIQDVYIPDPDFYPSGIPDPTTALKRRGKIFFFLPFL